jgi:hypothetical protein
MNKEHDRLIGSILVLLICVIAVIWGTRDGEVAEVPAAAIEASYGEEPKPEGHGR